jgi:hypothetical protein
MTVHNGNYLDAGAASPYQLDAMTNATTILVARRRRTIAVRAAGRV